jgi:hypothetical protein
MASGEDEQDDDLAEFRTSSGKQAPVSTASDVIREELVVTTKPAASSSSASSSFPEEEQMADIDFMNDLENM